MPTITQSEVIAAIEKAIEMQPGSLSPGASANEIEIWDSLGQLSILVALDKLFDGKIAGISDMAEADTVSKILVVLRQHSLL